MLPGHGKDPCPRRLESKLHQFSERKTLDVFSTTAQRNVGGDVWEAAMRDIV